MRDRSMIAPPAYYGSLDDALIVHLQGLLDLELVGKEMLALVARACLNPLAQAALDEHREQASFQIARLEQGLELLGAMAERRANGFTAGLADDLRAVAGADGDPDVRDAALLAGVQAWKHAEIAAYGTARAWAERLDHHEVAGLLTRSLDEEAVCDERLSALAAHLVNLDAGSGLKIVP